LAVDLGLAEEPISPVSKKLEVQRIKILSAKDLA
jgi:hypothetical protein